MRILKVTLLLLLLSFIYWSMGDTFFNWLFPFSSKGKGPWITVEGVAPKYTKPYVSAVYKSKDCLEYEFSATMTPHKVPTYNGLSLDVKADPETGYFQAKLPFSGGGWCKWRIEQAFVTVGYTDVSHLVKDAIMSEGGRGTGLTVFINDAPRTYLSETEALNTINYSPTIYPILKMVQSWPKRIFLQGELGMRPFRLKLTPGAEWKITFKPKLDETKMPKVIVTKEKELVEYPNGHIETDTQMVDIRYIK
ncbi:MULTISPECIES: hypothetical protein [Photorhabdus]|uniref:Uncharacterized protein n=2 Tax=Photorhabdus asymbiotica TaxID=291112 RepID=B6VMP4_PHOAA|nr:hypothetical protein [Photorhabdus asymbiotica]CAQ82810.1 conserved hypothetical protein [Photorhabdus asymbiotica]CAR67424.1 Hypothetical Protein PA-RVA13-1295 [Photorhabdus asymbiotica subsp. asymbiotica ATCC 43949]